MSETELAEPIVNYVVGLFRVARGGGRAPDEDKLARLLDQADTDPAFRRVLLAKPVQTAREAGLRPHRLRYLLEIPRATDDELRQALVAQVLSPRVPEVEAGTTG